MRIAAKHRRTLVLAAAVAGSFSMPGVASAQAKIYPPGTDCGNQPTIAERLLCGRQEFRREQGLSIDQPTDVPGEADEPGPFPDQPLPPAELRPPAQEQPPEPLTPRTASPTH